LGTHFCAAIREYGPESFSIHELDSTDDEKRLNWLESFYIGLLRSTNPEFGYNQTFEGEGGVPTKEVREKISIAGIRVWQDPEYRKRMTALVQGHKNPMFGRNHTDEAKKRIGESAKEREHPSGWKHTEETKLKMRKKRRPFSEEARRNMGLARLGKIRGPYKKREVLC
jgi:hypothetical protein